MAKNIHEINLMPKSGNAYVMDFLNWALTIGRLLIIIVETLALGTFIYRFSWDYQIGNYKDKISPKRQQVLAFKPMEDSYRNLQSRLDLIKKYDEQSKNSPQILNDIVEMGRGYISFRNIYISNTSIRIEAQAATVAPLTAFVNSLKKYPLVNTLSIDKVENKTSSVAIIVGITATLKQNGPVENVSNEQLQSTSPFSETK